MFDLRVVVRTRVAHEIEGPSEIRLVDGIEEDHSGGAAEGAAKGAAGSCPSEGDAKGAHDERLVESLQVRIARLCRDGAKRVARLLEDGGDVGQFGHDEGGGRSAQLVVRLM